MWLFHSEMRSSTVVARKEGYLFQLSRSRSKSLSFVFLFSLPPTTDDDGRGRKKYSFDSFSFRPFPVDFFCSHGVCCGHGRCSRRRRPGLRERCELKRGAGTMTPAARERERFLRRRPFDDPQFIFLSLSHRPFLSRARAHKINSLNRSGSSRRSISPGSTSRGEPQAPPGPARSSHGQRRPAPRSTPRLRRGLPPTALLAGDRGRGEGGCVRIPVSLSRFQ